MANAPRRVRSRTQSISSDRPSATGPNLMAPPLTVSPEAVYIAASAASQIVTNDHDSHAEKWYDQTGIEPSGEAALVSPNALQLANNFVDQILFNIIAIAKSTSLSTLRPAVSDVLKPKLAKDAINNADEELKEYLGGGEAEELARSVKPEASTEWDLELTWKRTRLRCMVYSSLGDMEEEDEDVYMEQEHLRAESDDYLSEVVSPAVAIFLTSILEFMGEQVLVIAGQAAFNRLRSKYEKELKEGTRTPGGFFDRIVVEELDMERVALDRTLGRLWRAWKKKIRSPMEPNYSRPFSRNSVSTTHQRRGSAATDRRSLSPTHRNSDSALAVQKEHDGGVAKEEASQKVVPKEINPADMPLPESDVEGTYSDEGESAATRGQSARPMSLVVLPRSAKAEATHTSIRRVRSLPTGRRPRHLRSRASSRGTGNRQSQAERKEAEKDVISTMEGKESSTSANKRFGEKTTANGLILPKLDTRASSSASMATTSDALHTDFEEDEIDDFTEEPEILTSSRISIGGRSSPSTSESGKPASLILGRSNSVRSVRVIEVQSPRSPTVGSRANSMDVYDPALNSRRIATPPIVEENRADKRIITQTAYDRSQDVVVAPPRNPSPLRSVHSQSLQPLHEVPAPTKVSIVSGPGPDGFQEEKPATPLKMPRNPPLPTLPERSTSRPNYGRSSSAGVSSDTSARRGTPESPLPPLPVPSESPSSTSTKFKAVRSSEDNGAEEGPNFEQLLNSGETIQYTLTPETMRDIESSSNGSPKPSTRSHRSDDARLHRSRSSSSKRSTSASRQSNPITKQTSLGSHPPTDLPITRKFPGSVPNMPISVPPKGRSAAVPQAREARIPRESLHDFAEFIRSTGPPGEHSAKYSRMHAGSVGTVRVSADPSHAKSASIDSRKTSSTMRTHYQAREAAVNPGSENSDLIDFIRRGPPNSNNNNHRIPRHVAPFRTTMDSDQMQMTGATGGKAIDAVIPNIRNSEIPTNVMETSAPSSMNSQSALLHKANRVQQQQPGNSFDDDDMMPKRTRRRVRDPYAIDFSDEEEEEEDDLFDIVPTPKPKPKREESLIDFLNSYPPPPEPIQQSVTIPKKKHSAPNLMARLRSSGSSIGRSASSAGSKAFNMAESRSLNSRASLSNNKGHTPIVIPSRPVNFGREPVPNTNAPLPPLPTTSSSGRVPMKKFEPRDAVSGRSATSDLATFLRDSEPPPQTMASLPSPTENKSNGLSRMFERRKRYTAF
ncbi:uncharacterized protein GGS25DRAFT_359407 [Hypoxylon fragiforme]|uniref:uncharacterized protein n=1 Tax=Hypoxylon fragiforme TaxID=63214 RepID=UPI0020C6E536|nr:uncharacterized protein GGS25DRAFT_359407 [Hypoxylon fragiforme]KAI2605867.1 hypothetical protein GGS25DRAFT_359407 [Hypoxylon fragiforme]